MRIPRAPVGLVLGVLLQTPGVASGAEPPGVVVEEVAKGSTADKAGLQGGDVLLFWARPGTAGGRLTSAFDFADLEIEQAPRGEVSLRIERAGGALSATLHAPPWGLRVRPVERERAAWLQLQAADAHAASSRWDEAHAAYRAATEAAREARSPIAVAHACEAEGRAFQRQNELKEAEAAFRAALVSLEPLGRGEPAHRGGPPRAGHRARAAGEAGGGGGRAAPLARHPREADAREPGRRVGPAPPGARDREPGRSRRRRRRCCSGRSPFSRRPRRTACSWPTPSTTWP